MKKLFLIISILLLSITCLNVKAITKEELEDAIASITSESDSTQISIDDEYIYLTSETKEAKISYDLEKNEFVYVNEIPNDITYEEYKELNNDISSVIIPLYGLNAGIDTKDVLSYLSAVALSSLSGTYTLADANYMIVSDGVTVEGDSDTLVIEESKFSEYLDDVLDLDYADAKVMSDNTDDGLGLFKETIERKKMDNGNNALVTTLTVNEDADFSKLDGYYDKLVDSFIPNDIKAITKDNADYYVKLYVGQEFIISSDQDIKSQGYYYGVVEGNEEKESTSTTIYKIATEEGTGKAVIETGGKKYTFYIEVVANDSDKEYDAYEVTITSAKEETKKEETKAAEATEETGKGNPDTGIFIPATVGLLLIGGIAIASRKKQIFMK